MKVFIIEKKEYPFTEEVVKYELALAKTKEETQNLRAAGAYEVPKKQAVEVFGLYLPFADSKNTKITKTADGFQLKFDLKKDMRDKAKKGLSSLWDYVKRILIALDQVANTLLNGYEDESLSSRFYRWSLKDGLLWKIPAKIVDTVLFFDTAKDEDGKIMHHCEKSFENELKRTGLPVTMR